jgi:hypothetical protein
MYCSLCESKLSKEEMFKNRNEEDPLCDECLEELYDDSTSYVDIREDDDDFGGDGE